MHYLDIYLKIIWKFSLNCFFFKPFAINILNKYGFVYQQNINLMIKPKLHTKIIYGKHHIEKLLFSDCTISAMDE